MDLGKGLRETLAKLSGKAYVDEEAVRALIKDLQRVLISSDVNVKLVLALSKRIEERSLKTDKMQALSLKEHVLKVVYEELVNLMGTSYTPRMDKHKVLICGLFGSGKTTSVNKLANFYKGRGLSAGVIAADVDRPAAQEQLEQLAKKSNVEFFTIKDEKNASKIVERGIKTLKSDVIIVDSAGRSAFDNDLASELQKINDVLEPEEVYLVISGDIGQIASKQAEEFNKIAKLSGVIVTKMDGSGKGGGALSAVGATEAKVAFIGTGEKVEDFEIYNSEKFVGKLLGVPDIGALMEKIQKIAKEENLKNIESEELTIETFYQQLKAAKKLGPLGNVMGMLGVSDLPKDVVQQSEGKMKKYEAMINSMTKKEKKDAALLKKQPTRVARIAKGSGTGEKDVREFLAQFEKIEKMMNMFRKNRGFRSQIEKMMKGGNMAGLKMN
ncbi:MAG: signal recognition particle receptor subunit alpha [Candidatus Micrarchaeota archaeon]